MDYTISSIKLTIFLYMVNQISNRCTKIFKYHSLSGNHYWCNPSNFSSSKYLGSINVKSWSSTAFSFFITPMTLFLVFGWIQNLSVLFFLPQLGVFLHNWYNIVSYSINLLSVNFLETQLFSEHTVLSKPSFKYLVLQSIIHASHNHFYFDETINILS